jgi:hypothetical protein
LAARKPLTDRHEHTLLDGVAGPGHYVGTYLAWGSNSSGWWGEGEMKFYLDGDDEFPTICGTGTEDYSAAPGRFESPRKWAMCRTRRRVSRPAAGAAQSAPVRGMYRWHLPDPIRFEHDLRVYGSSPRIGGSGGSIPSPARRHRIDRAVVVCRPSRGPPRARPWSAT